MADADLLTYKFLSYPTNIIVFTSLLAVIYIANAIHIWNRLLHIPGPPLVGFSKWWLVKSHRGGNTHLELKEVCEKYGSLARIGPNALVTSNPDVLRRMLAVRGPYKRSDWYDGMRFDPSSDNILSQRDEVKHSDLRAKMAAGYAGKENDKLEQTIDEYVALLIKLVDQNYISTVTEFKPMDFGRKAQYFTLDVISGLAFGKAFGDMETDSDVHRYIEMIEYAGPAIIMTTVFPWINRLVALPIVKYALPSAKDKIGFGRVMGVAKEIVGERFGPNKKVQRDMLGSFLAHGLTQKEAESELLLQILAGSDTTATAIRATMLYILTNHYVYSKLLDEISNSGISSPVKDAEAKKMPYLQAIIKEGLRIWPPVTGLSSKEVPVGGDVINGVFVPGGTKIGVSFWGMARNKKTWGEDANQFRPERWLDSSFQKLKEMEQAWEIIFSWGKWQCLGKSIAMMELNKVFVELLRHFEFEIVDPTKPWNSACLGIFVQHNMWMRVTRRKPKL